MGYRSDVMSLIYGPPEKVDALTMRFRHTHPFDLWDTENDAFGQYLTEWLDPVSGDKFIRIVGEGWKWYEGYASVEAWGAFLAMAADLGLSNEFMRVGEEPADIESTYEGDDCRYLLGVSRMIYCDIDPAEAEEASDDQAQL